MRSFVVAAALAVSLPLPTEAEAQSIVTQEPLVNARVERDGRLVVTPSATSSARDFDFFDGNWKIHHRRLTTRLRNDTAWTEYDGTNEVRRILEGIGHTNNNRSLVGGVAREGMGLTLFNPQTRLWSIYWASSADGVLDRAHPVVGSFEGDIGTFYARERIDGKPILVMARWDRTNPDSAVWSQAFSADDGVTWEWNWYMHEVRVDELDARAQLPDVTRHALPVLRFDADGELVVTASPTSSPRDFDFLTGRWEMHNRRLATRLRGDTTWSTYVSHDVNFGPILQGLGNTDLYRAEFDGKPYEGFTLRLFNPETRLWSLYWVDSEKGTLDPPVVGSFDGDVGIFVGKDVHQGVPIVMAFVWDRTDPNNPVWGQAFTTDGGRTWEWNLMNVSHRRHLLPVR